MKTLHALAISAALLVASHPTFAQVKGSIEVELRNHGPRGGVSGLIFGTEEPNTSALCQTTDTTAACDIQNNVQVGWLSIFNLERHRSKKLLRIIGGRDCEGARRYAFDKADFKLIHNLEKFCPGYASAKPVAIASLSNPYDLPMEVRPGMTPEEIGRVQGRRSLAGLPN
jgi:hypothetical protein